jgi:2-amino-4-hydroxy-6-hydroxymethyldihydropteridine diphosphokinase
VDRAVAGTPRTAAIALGSNLGDRARAIVFARDQLAGLLSNLVLSAVVETEPEGEGLGDQPLYLNAAITGVTGLDARSLLDALLDIERAFGRERPYVGAPRTLDLDLILLGDETIDEPGLHVPHPRFRDRFFVLGPLAEIASNMRDPVTGLSVSGLLQRLLHDQTR